MKNILIVDDEENILNLIKFNLEREGYNPIVATDGYIALEKLKSRDIDLIVLDIMLPKIDGYEVCSQLRKNNRYNGIPVIFLSAKDGIEDKVRGLDLGATDYLTKPFSTRELLSRIKVIFRRMDEAEENSLLHVGQILLDINRHQIFFNEQKVELTYKEFELLKLLLQNYQHVYSREELLEEVWGEESLTTLRTIDVHIRNLRSKFQEYQVNNPTIDTIRGVGYRLNLLDE